MANSTQSDDLRERYLDLLAGSLLGTVHQDTFVVVGNGATPSWRTPVRRALRIGQEVAGKYGYELLARQVPRATLDEGGRWPLVGETMVGSERLRNVRACLDMALNEGIAGDFIETGIWRGGCSIFAAAVLETSPHENTKRVFVADSFRGLPEADYEKYPEESREPMSEMKRLAVSRGDVEENFGRYGISAERVVIVEGWFSDSLAALDDHEWAVVRLDGDMYESTMDALTALYRHVTTGGFVIVDDYWEMDSCRAAVDDFRRDMAVSEPLTRVDSACVMWRRSA